VSCLFCGGDASEPNHLRNCDGRRSSAEASPSLISGLTPDTWDTSEVAALSVDDAKDTQRRNVYDAIRAAGAAGCTDDELQIRLNLDGSSERPRRLELWKLDAIEVLRDGTGAPIRRLTRTHRWAVVWVVKERHAELSAP
jgi:hypothetical protein